jgi:hypothetical protein
MRTLAVILLLALCSCSQSPSETQGKEALQEYLSEQVDGSPFEIVSFSKSDGQKMEVQGTPFYKLMFVADVSFPKGYHPECLKLEQYGGMEGFQIGMQCSNKFNPFSDNPLKALPEGDKTKLSGNIIFSKSENGWLKNEINLVSSTPQSAGENALNK